jgi:antitoxin VapB
VKTTKTFKSGNSVAVRLPKALGVEAGTEMRVREERGKYVLEPVRKARRQKIDLTGIYGSMPRLKAIKRDEDDYEDIPRQWHLLGLDAE